MGAWYFLRFYSVTSTQIALICLLFPWVEFRKILYNLNYRCSSPFSVISSKLLDKVFYFSSELFLDAVSVRMPSLKKFPTVTREIASNRWNIAICYYYYMFAIFKTACCHSNHLWCKQIIKLKIFSLLSILAVIRRTPTLTYSKEFGFCLSSC